MPRGGHRIGSGRKPSDSVTKSIVSRMTPDESQYLFSKDEFKRLLEYWEHESRNSSPTSPRWSKARQLLADLRELFPTL